MQKRGLVSVCLITSIFLFLFASFAQAQKKQLTYKQAYMRGEPSLTTPLPRIQGWLNDDYYLESKTDEIEWWCKNGENDAKHFAIPYGDKGTSRAFYVDWIVKYKNGKLALFDTKSGITAETAKSKAEGLYKYIKEQNSKGKNLFGGIVINKDGSWRYNGNEVYEYDKANLKSWRYLG